MLKIPFAKIRMPTRFAAAAKSNPFGALMLSSDDEDTIAPPASPALPQASLLSDARRQPTSECEWRQASSFRDAARQKPSNGNWRQSPSSSDTRRKPTSEGEWRQVSSSSDATRQPPSSSDTRRQPTTKKFDDTKLSPHEIVLLKAQMVNVARKYWRNLTMCPEERNAHFIKEMCAEYLPHMKSVLTMPSLDDGKMKNTRVMDKISNKITKLLELMASISFHELFKVTDEQYMIKFDIVNGILLYRLQTISTNFSSFIVDGKINIFLAWIAVNFMPDEYTPIHWIPFSIFRDEPKKPNPTRCVPEYRRSSDDVIAMYEICYSIGYTPISLNKIEKVVDDDEVVKVVKPVKSDVTIEKAFEAALYAKKAGRFAEFRNETDEDGKKIDGEKKIFDWLLLQSPKFIVEDMANSILNKFSIHRDKTGVNSDFADTVKWLCIIDLDSVLSCLVRILFNFKAVNDNSTDLGKKYEYTGYSELVYAYIDEFFSAISSPFDVSSNTSIGYYLSASGKSKEMNNCVRRIGKLFFEIFENIQTDMFAMNAKKFEKEDPKFYTNIAQIHYVGGMITGLMCDEPAVLLKFIEKNMTLENCRRSFACMTACQIKNKITFFGTTICFQQMIEILDQASENKVKFAITDILRQFFNMPRSETSIPFMKSRLLLTQAANEGGIGDWETLAD